VPLFKPEALEIFLTEVFTRLGMPPSEGAKLAELLIENDLHGKETHGCMRVADYCSLLEAGAVNPAPRIRVIKDHLASAVMDGDNGFGHLVGLRALEESASRARTYGIGIVVAKRSGHLGALGSLVRRISDQGLIGMIASNTSHVVSPFGGRSATLGNNPIAIAVPTRSLPIIIDVAWSVSSRGRIILAAAKNSPIPPDWAVDAEGHPTVDAAQALKGALLPLGGHKGYVLALAVELLTAALGGEVTSGPPGFIHPPERNRPLGFCHIAAAMMPSAFINAEDFLEQVEAVVKRMRETPAVGSSKGVRIPGDRASSLAVGRRANGIQLAGPTTQKLQRLAEKLGVKMPSPIDQRNSN